MSLLKNLGAILAKPDLAVDAVFIVGTASLSYGAGTIYPPAGFVVCGIVLLSLVFFGVRR